MSKLKSRPTLPHRGLPEVSPKADIVRHSGHLVDQKLQSSSQSNTLIVLNELTVAEQFKFDTCEIEVVGLPFSLAQEKMVHALYLLLRETSQHKDAQSDLFYKGNVQVPGDAVVMRVTRAALYKAYTGASRYSGKTMREVDETLRVLSERKYFVRYQRHRWGKKGEKEKRVDQVKQFINLLSLKEIDMDLTPKELAQLNRGERVKDRGNKSCLEIALDGIFTDQISSKYVEYPADINQRLGVAAGGAKKITPAITRLRDHLLRGLSYKHKKLEINTSTLIEALGLEKFAREGRKGLVQKHMDRAIEVCGNLGLYKTHIVVHGKQGQLKHVFELNSEFK